MSKTMYKYIKKAKGPKGPYFCEETYYIFKTSIVEILSLVSNPLDMYRIKKEYFDYLPHVDEYRQLFIDATEKLNPLKVLIWRILLWKHQV